MTDQELNEKLLKFQTGLVQIVSPEDDQYHKGIWTGEDGMRCDTPDFPTDLDACFRWLVPKALDKLASDNDVNLQRARTYLITKWLSEWNTSPNEPALALCKAIEQLIKEESCQKE